MKHYDGAFASLMKQYEETFKDHTLKKIGERLYYMGRPQTGLYCAYLSFHGGCVGITGDIVIEGNGVFSSPGYQLEWFVGELHADYLGTKFLQRSWVRECAMDFVEDGLRELKEDMPWDDRESKKEIESALRDIRKFEAWDQYEFARIWEEHADGRWPRMWYKPAALAMLSTVQKTFVRLYRELHPGIFIPAPTAKEAP